MTNTPPRRFAPFAHWVCDDFFGDDLTRAAEADWPAADWPHWVRYDGAVEQKLACHEWHRLPSSCYQLLEEMLRFPVSALTGTPRLVADAGLWGAGLHAVPPGGQLGVHLDADRHKFTGRRRLYTGILFLDSEWDPGWGGRLELHSQNREAVANFLPCRGRLVLMANTDWSFHAVEKVRGRVARKTLAVFWYGEKVPESKRPRAVFDGIRHAE